MISIRPEHIRRVNFATRLYPKLVTSLNIDGGKFKSAERFDGEAFCGGRSINKDLLAFFGLLSPSQRCASTYAQLPLFRRSIRKLTNLVETELEILGAQEVLLPSLIPRKLWIKSNRSGRQKDAFDNVYQLKDGADNELLLGPTFEESITQLVGDCNPIHEHELPLLLYQTSQKFRYEPNPRFGLLRSNEFLMNDMYSFDTTIDTANETYAKVASIYERIFARLGFNCLKSEGSTGNIGGVYSHEYHLPISSGEDTLIKCDSCDFAYNIDILKADGSDRAITKCLKCDSENVERILALELGHTFLLSDVYSKPLNVGIKCEDGQRRDFQMGCYGLGLTRMLGAGIDFFSITPRSGTLNKDNIADLSPQLRWPNEVEPFTVGVVTPAKRSKQYQGGSDQFVERILACLLDTTNPEVDFIVEDRDKDGIFKRLAKLQCLGIPNIVVIGKRFLEDPLQVEVLKLSSDKRTYDQHWLTEDQLYDYFKKELRK